MSKITMYDQVTNGFVKSLLVDDPKKIRLTKYNIYTQIMLSGVQ